MPLYKFLTLLILLLVSNSSILTFRYAFFLFLKCLLASRLILFKLSTLLRLGSCIHCILACFLWSKKSTHSLSNHGLCCFQFTYYVDKISVNLPLLGAFKKSRKPTISFVILVCLSVRLPVRPSACPSVCLSVRLPVRPSACPSFCLHGRTRLPVDEFSWNFIFKHSSNICLKKSASIEIWKQYRVFYLNIYAHLWYFVEMFVEWETFRKNS